MSEQMIKICELAEQVELALFTSEIKRATSNNTKSAVIQKNLTSKYAHTVKSQAIAGQLSPSIESQTDELAQSYELLQSSGREPAFKCVSSYKACKSEANSIEDKVLCGLALAICFAKEVVPLA